MTTEPRIVVYLVVERAWEFDDPRHVSTIDGITHRVFLSFEQAEAHARELVAAGVLSHWEVVSLILEDATE